MGSFVRTAGSVAAAALAGPALIAVAAPALADPSPESHVVRVSCDSTALATAIRSAVGPTTLRLAPRCTYSIITPASDATALPAIAGDIMLVGEKSTTIQRDPKATTDFRILDVAAGGTLSAEGIIIRNGRTSGLGGGIQNAGTLRLDRTVLVGNHAGNGGAIANLAGAHAVISRSTLATNTTSSVGGGAIINFGVMTITGSHMLGNTAPINGGGLNTQPNGQTRFTDSTVDHNTSGGLGGGVSNLGTTSLDRSLVTSNRGSAGGGIATGNDKVMTTRSLVVTNAPDNCSPLNTISGCVS
jgi:hypothetical protein